MLYSINKFRKMESFDRQRVYKFFKIRYSEALEEDFNEEQLYFYYAIKILGFTDILTDAKNAVLESDNQILISYYLKDDMFNKDDLDILKEKDNEMYWFQSYHLILYCDDLRIDLENNINKYLCPKMAMKKQQKLSYINFYKDNLSEGNVIVRDINDINSEIENYVMLRISESEGAFKAATEDK